MYSCIVIDDEELARLLLKSYIEKCDFLELKGLFSNPIEALSALKSNQIDLVFLDIQMPDLKGTDFAKMVPSSTKIIFTTAYSEYALDGFELNALDYLLKPITFERFLKAVNKIESKYKIGNTEFITIKSGYNLHKVKLTDILYIQSDSEYVVFYLRDKKIMSYQTLKSLEDSLPQSLFMRVHRSYIINKKEVSSLVGKDVTINKVKIPVSARYFDTVKEQLFP
jgi:DNA-binding LytR/AlgR family response regulator